MSQQPPKELSGQSANNDLVRSFQELARAASEAEKAVGGKGDGGGDAIVIPPIAAVHAGMQLGNWVFQTVKLLSVALARGFIAPAEVIFRRQIGERYYSPMTWIACAAANTGALLLDILPQSLAPYPATIFLIGASVHRLVCFIRDRFGGYWHSYSDGVSNLRIPAVDRWLTKWFFTLEFSKVVLEPLVLLALAIVANMTLPHTVYHVPTPAGVLPFSAAPLHFYLLLLSVVFFAYQLYVWGERRDKVLDEKDAFVGLEAKREANSVTERPGLTAFKGVSYIPANRP